MTNIVITATMHLILAAANQFAERAELDIQLPIEAKDITELRGRTNVYRGLTFTVAGRHKFYWQTLADLQGKFVSYDDLKFSSIYMDREKFLPSLTNVPSLISTNEALKIAERCLNRLGYDKRKQYRLPALVAQYTHQTSQTDTPKLVPLFGIRWLPKKKDAWEEFVFQIQVSGITKKVTGFCQLTFEGTSIDLRQFTTNSPPAISTNARKPRFASLTNGMNLSGIVELTGKIDLNSSDVPLYFGLCPEDEVPQPPGVQIYSFSGTNDIPRLTWNTHRATNGTYTLCPAVGLAGDILLRGDTVIVTVSNAIQMPTFNEVFGTGLPIAATITSNNALYKITIRSESGNLIRTLTGVANGFEITDYWNGLDESGSYALTNDSVTVTISY